MQLHQSHTQCVCRTSEFLHLNYPTLKLCGFIAETSNLLELFQILLDIEGIGCQFFLCTFVLVLGLQKYGSILTAYLTLEPVEEDIVHELSGMAWL